MGETTTATTIVNLDTVIDGDFSIGTGLERA